MSDAAPRHVTVYGGDHSPWVQAVLLGLHERGIPHTAVTVPPASVFRRSGVLMPAARLDDGPWQLGSGQILAALGYAKVSPEETLDLFRALGGGVHRVDSGPRFWHRWSWVRDGHPSRARRLRNHFLRSFSVLYFYLALKGLARRAAPLTPERIRRQFLTWEQRLARGPGPFLGGATPDTVDFQLFGGIQCHCSIPDPTLPVLRDDPALGALRAWLGAMQARYADYPHLYSGAAFEPRAGTPEPAPPLERAAFWLGSACTLLAAPLTVPLAVFYRRRVRARNLLGLPRPPRPAPGV